MNVCANNHHMSPTAPSATPSRLRPAAESETIHTNIPARLDRLPWSRFHWLMVIALGVAWILDGLEVTIVGAIGPVLEDPQTLALSAAQVGNTASSYVIGAVIGACCSAGSPTASAAGSSFIPRSSSIFEAANADAAIEAAAKEFEVEPKPLIAVRWG